MSSPDRSSRPDPLLDVREVAYWLGLSTKTVYRLAEEGRLPGAIKVSNRLRFDPKRIRAWLDQQEVRRGQ